MYNSYNAYDDYDDEGEYTPSEVFDSSKDGSVYDMKLGLDYIEKTTPNILQGTKDIALHYAAKRGRLACCRLLLELGANISIACMKVDSYYASVSQSIYATTAVHEAALKGHYEVVKLLLDKGADIRKKCSFYECDLLHAAVSSGNMKLFRLLLEVGASIYSLNRYQQSTLIVAAESGHAEICRVLIALGCDVNHKDENGFTALNKSVYVGHYEVVSVLLQAGAIDYENKDGLIDETALFHAVCEGHSEIARILLEKRTYSDLNKLDTEGDTLLCTAAKNGYPIILRLLVEKGADIKGKSGESYDNYTALHAAVTSDKLACIRVLLELGADIEDKDFLESTPLLTAASESRDIETLRLLLERGANISEIDALGHTVLHQAVNNIHTRDLRRIRDEEIVNTRLENGKDFIRFLLDRCKDQDQSIISAQNDYGETVLHLCALFNKTEYIKLFIDYGVDLELEDGHGNTCLYLAIKENRIDMIRLLLDSGALIYEKKTETIENKIFKQLLLDEACNRSRRAAFDSFIIHHIEYPLYKNNIYSVCFPSGTKNAPPIGWLQAEAIRDKYYFDEIFFYLHLFIANSLVNQLPSHAIIAQSSCIADTFGLSKSHCKSCSRKIRGNSQYRAKNSDTTSTLMIVLTDRLKQYLKPVYSEIN